MTNEQITKPKYDLEERTAKFGEEVIKFVKKIPLNDITRPIIRQLIRAATSIGANYCEADSAHSKKDFNHKIALCKKESRETMYWLRMISQAASETRDDAARLWQEAKELNLIFSAIIKKK